MGDTPQKDRHEADKRHPILLDGELLLGRSYGPDLKFPIRRGGPVVLENVYGRGEPRRAVRHEEEQPYKQDRYRRDGQRDGEPPRPIERWIHRMQRDQVLGRGYGRALSAHISCEGDAELCHRSTK